MFKFCQTQNSASDSARKTFYQVPPSELMNKTLNNCFGSGFLVSESRITEANFSRKELVTAVASGVSGKTRELRLEDNQPGGAVWRSSSHSR